MSRKSITITLPEAMIANIDVAAQKAGLNRSQYIESLVKARGKDGDLDSGYVKTDEVRGTTRAVFEFFSTFYNEGNPSATFDMDRERILRMYVKPTAEELAKFKGQHGGMAITLEGASSPAAM